MKIYMVTGGEYSDDYYVLGIYSTMEKAEYAKKLYNTKNDIVEKEIDRIPEHPQGMVRWHVHMNKDGDMSDVERDGVDYIREFWMPRGNDEEITFFIWAKDEENAIRKSNEIRIKLINDNKWTTDYDEWVKRESKE